MKVKLIAVVFFAVAMPLGDAHAQRTGVGAGVILGAPTGISAKFWTSSDNAIDVPIG